MPIHRHLRLGLFRLKPLQGWHIPREGLFFLFPRAGEGEYVCEAPERPIVQSLASGDVLVVHAGARGVVRTGPGAELAFSVFSVCIEHLVPILVADEISLVQPLLDALKTFRFYPAGNPVTVAWHQLIVDVAPASDLEHRSQLLRVAGAILSEEFKKLRPPLSQYERADAHLTRLFEQLSVEQILNLSVEEMASRFGCSQRHLNRLFNHHFGVSVGLLRMEMRLLKAVPLLRNPDFKIVHVAKQCGFNHLGLFNTCFKRRFGVSPGQWRKSIETEERPARDLGTGQPTCRLREFGLCPLGDALGEAIRARSSRLAVTDGSSAVEPVAQNPGGQSQGL